MEREIEERIANYTKRIEWYREDEQNIINELKSRLEKYGNMIYDSIVEIDNSRLRLMNIENEIKKYQERITELENLKRLAK